MLLSKLEQKVLIHIKAECKKFGIKCLISKGKYIKLDGIKVNGYFDSDNLLLRFSTGTPNWLLVASHEYCHMLQYIENCPSWKAFGKNNINFTDWLNGQKLSIKKLNKVINLTIDVERDCEQRSSEFLKSFGYKKIEEYIQKANAYTLFYYYMRDNRVWYKIGQEPYNFSTVWKNFPKTLDIDKITVYNSLKNYYYYCVA